MDHQHALVKLYGSYFKLYLSKFFSDHFCVFFTLKFTLKTFIHDSSLDIGSESSGPDTGPATENLVDKSKEKIQKEVKLLYLLKNLVNKVAPTGKFHYSKCDIWDIRGGSRTAATSKMDLSVIIVKPLTIITKSSILDVAAVLDPPLM